MALITIVSVLSPLIPIITGIKKVKSLLWYYAVIGLFCNLLISPLPHEWATFKAIMANTFVLLEFLLLTAVYKSKIFNSRNKTYWYSFIAACCLFFIILYAQTGIGRFNTIGSAMFCFIYICLSLYGFTYFIKQPHYLRLEKSGFFVSNAAILIYASSVFFVFLTGFIFQDISVKVQLWHWVVEPMNAFKYLLIGISLTLKDP